MSHRVWNYLSCCEPLLANTYMYVHLFSLSSLALSSSSRVQRLMLMILRGCIRYSLMNTDRLSFFKSTRISSSSVKTRLPPNPPLPPNRWRLFEVTWLKGGVSIRNYYGHSLHFLLKYKSLTWGTRVRERGKGREREGRGGEGERGGERELAACTSLPLVFIITVELYRIKIC